MRLKGKTWTFFIGYDPEPDNWSVRLHWGGRSEQRSISGLYHYKRRIVVWFRKPRFEWPTVGCTMRGGFYP